MAIDNLPSRAEGCLDYEELMKTIKYLLDASWGPDWGRFSPDGPNVSDPKNVEYPIVIHSIRELRPGLVGNTTREMKPRYRYTFQNEGTDGGEPAAMTVYGQLLDSEIVFELWEETNAALDKLEKQFRQTIASFTGYLKKKGLREIQFIRMAPASKNFSDSYKVRELTYFVRFEELVEVPTDIFRVIDVVEERFKKDAETQLNG